MQWSMVVSLLLSINEIVWMCVKTIPTTFNGLLKIALIIQHSRKVRLLLYTTETLLHIYNIVSALHTPLKCLLLTTLYYSKWSEIFALLVKYFVLRTTAGLLASASKRRPTTAVPFLHSAQSLLRTPFHNVW